MSFQTQKPYKYAPIAGEDRIRLIELHPSHDLSAPLECGLIHTKLSLCDSRDIFGHYTALSYVWGNPAKKRVISIDGETIGITANLHSALLDLRDDSRTLLLWVDAVCINQVDVAEKAAKIALMGQIYAGAQHTVVYLGAGSRRGLRKGDHIIKKLHRGPVAKLDINAVLNSEWFTRVWVFQELIFSRRPWLQIGRMRIEWDSFIDSMPPDADILNLTRPFDETPVQDFTALSIRPLFEDMEKAREYHHRRSNMTEVNVTRPRTAFERHILKQISPNCMTELLRSRRGLGVTDPRDMIFAHVGFATDGHEDSFAIDYSKTTAQLFQDSGQYIANTYGITAMLECTSFEQSTACLKELPSWAPDWTSKIIPKNYLGQGVDLSLTHGVVPKAHAVHRDSGIMSCLFTLVDTVVFTSVALPAREPFSDVLKDIRAQVGSDSLSVVCNDSDGIFHHGCILQQDVWFVKDSWPAIRGFWAKTINDNRFLPADWSELESLTKIRFHERHYINISVNLFLALAVLDERNYTYLAGKRFARMASGRLAIVPESTQDGDIIVASVLNNRAVYHYVFHPLDPNTGGDRAVIDREILQSIEDVRNGEDWTLLHGNIGSVNSTDTPIVHCHFVGECFVQQDVELATAEEYNHPKVKGIIAAIH